jgi:hypothetical protein
MSAKVHSVNKAEKIVQGSQPFEGTGFVTPLILRLSQASREGLSAQLTPVPAPSPFHNLRLSRPQYRPP